MNEDRSQIAQARIEAALKRIEAASTAAPASADSGAVAMIALRSRHDRLKGAVTTSLAELDALIAAVEG